MASKNQLIDDICRILDCSATGYQKRQIRDLIERSYRDKIDAARKAEGGRLFKRTVADLNRLPADVRADVLQSLCLIQF